MWSEELVSILENRVWGGWGGLRLHCWQHFKVLLMPECPHIYSYRFCTSGSKFHFSKKKRKITNFIIVDVSESSLILYLQNPAFCPGSPQHRFAISLRSFRPTFFRIKNEARNPNKIGRAACANNFVWTTGMLRGGEDAFNWKWKHDLQLFRFLEWKWNIFQLLRFLQI